MVSIDLTLEEAELFKLFREYQDTFKLLVDSGVFKVGRSVVTLSIGSPGVVTSIDINSNLFKRRLTDRVNFDKIER